MIRYEWLYFHDKYLNKYPDLFRVYQVDSIKDLLKVYLCRLKVAALDNNRLILEDANGDRYNTFLIKDDYTEVGDTCLVPVSFKMYADGNIYLVASVGYQKIYSTYLDVFPDEYQCGTSVIKSRYISITDRIIVEVSDSDLELPDEFFAEYNLERKEVISDKVKNYLDTISLFDYDAKYKVVEEVSEVPGLETERNKKLQTFDSRQSKVYIFTKDMKKVLKKTNVMLADHKSKQFGMSALEFRALENKKLLELLSELGYSKEDVCFAKKEIGAIRVCIDKDNKVEVRARFAEINLDDHMIKNDFRYLQNGSTIELRDNHEWWFIEEDDT